MTMKIRIPAKKKSATCLAKIEAMDCTMDALTRTIETMRRSLEDLHRQLAAGVREGTTHGVKR